MSFDIEELQIWDERALEFVHKYGLNCYTQEFQICDHNEMIGYMAYSGMPSRYSHWSYGKNYERQKTLYDYGVAGLPYEMVINSDPCVAYLMRDNTLLLQILTIAHVYGHNDFFANNFTFTSGTNAKYTLEMFRNNSERIDKYMHDPSIGIDLVEDALDHAHSLSMQCSRNLAIKKLSQEEQRLRKWGRWYNQLLTGNLRYGQKSIVAQLMETKGVTIRSTAQYTYDNPELETIDYLVKQLLQQQPQMGAILRLHYTSDETIKEKVLQTQLPQRTYFRYVSKAEMWINERFYRLSESR